MASDLLFVLVTHVTRAGGSQPRRAGLLLAVYHPEQALRCTGTPRDLDERTQQEEQ